MPCEPKLPKLAHSKFPYLKNPLRRYHCTSCKWTNPGVGKFAWTKLLKIPNLLFFGCVCFFVVELKSGQTKTRIVLSMIVIFLHCCVHYCIFLLYMLVQPCSRVCRMIRLFLRWLYHISSILSAANSIFWLHRVKSLPTSLLLITIIHNFILLVHMAAEALSSGPTALYLVNNILWLTILSLE